jgi:hypothetical protein
MVQAKPTIGRSVSTDREFDSHDLRVPSSTVGRGVDDIGGDASGTEAQETTEDNYSVVTKLLLIESKIKPVRLEPRFLGFEGAIVLPPRSSAHP